MPPASKERLTLVYLVTNTSNGKIYVGKTCQTISRRWHEHKSRALASPENTHLYNAIRKYGVESFSIEEIAATISDKFAGWLEEFFIRKYESFKRSVGYNLTYGGDGCRPTDETRIKLSAWQKGRRPSEACEAAKIEALHKRKGIPRSEETKMKMSVAQKGRPLSDEHRQALRKPKKLSEETKKFRQDFHSRKDLVDSEIIALYQSGISSLKIAKKLNADPSTILWRLKRANVPRRRRKNEDPSPTGVF